MVKSQCVGASSSVDRSNKETCALQPSYQEDKTPVHSEVHREVATTSQRTHSKTGSHTSRGTHVSSQLGYRLH